MSNYPYNLDDDVTLPYVSDNITETGSFAINSLRDAIIEIEKELGLGVKGSLIDLAARLNVSINLDGTIKPSALASLGLLALPINDSHIAINAAIVESKLELDHATQDLYNLLTNLATTVNFHQTWIDVTGSKVEPHIAGTAFNHYLSHILVDTPYPLNKLGGSRNITNANTFLTDLNSELLYHQKADGYDASVTTQKVFTNNGLFYPASYAHHASGIYLDVSRWVSIPQSINDVQKLAQYINDNNLLTYSSRLVNLYSNGISRESRSTAINSDVSGITLVPNTNASSYLLVGLTSSQPVDDIDNGDDIVRFFPDAGLVSSHKFDAWFAKVKVGDTLVINYRIGPSGYDPNDTREFRFLIREKKYNSTGSKVYAVRINGKNLFHTSQALARVEKSLFNADKSNALSLSIVNNDGSIPSSLICSSPRGSVALGLGFNKDLFGTTNYNLYLEMYPTGDPASYKVSLPAIDVTGDGGKSTGKYTLDYIVEKTNEGFRKIGYNYRFVAFSYKGEFGIALAEAYNNCAFSINNDNLSNNVIGSTRDKDPLGYTSYGSGLASPRYTGSYSTANDAVASTKILMPSKRNNYYVNGSELEKFGDELLVNKDSNGDGYWFAKLITRLETGSRVKKTYRVYENLSTSKIASGKTLVIQPQDGYFSDNSYSDYGRFIIEDVEFQDCSSDLWTDITVYDSVHSIGSSPYANAAVDNRLYRVYFSDDSIGFNKEYSGDFNLSGEFKRYFEVYVDQYGKTFSNERARFALSDKKVYVNDIILYNDFELREINLIRVSPKLRGYSFNSVRKINLKIVSYDDYNGEIVGYLCKFDSVESEIGPTVTGKRGEVIRFYDKGHVDYIDIKFDLGETNGLSFTNKMMDIQLFPSLELDEEVMLLGVCQYNDSSGTISHLKDLRQFGNVSEKILSTSAIEFVTAGDRELHQNGIIRGFDKISDNGSGQVLLMGGSALIDGKIVDKDDMVVMVPPLKEVFSLVEYIVLWAICLDKFGDIVSVPLFDYSALVGNVNSGARIMVMKNMVNLNTFNMNGYYFSDLINNRKDLLVLYTYSYTP